MFKNIFLICCFLLGAGAGYSQFVDPIPLPEQNCHVNVNAYSEQDFRNDVKRAVFRINAGGLGNCSATLLNRATTQNELGQYFVTAWHCFKSGQNCDGSEFNWNDDVVMTFNFQSPDGQGQVFPQNISGQVYQITRKVRLVHRIVCAYGDFALCEILGDPIPPYFNVYYAGWYPEELWINGNGEFATLHHPRGTIKKISVADHLIAPESITKATCVTITKLIDFIVGWIWKRKWSTQVICTYTQVPFYGTKYKIANFDYGVTERGSSGGGLFTGQWGSAGANKLIGALSAEAPDHHCNPEINVGVSYFGKFADAYREQAIKNTLNPLDRWSIDQNGINGRQISCYPQINMNAGSGTINLYPASFYQQQNAITLTAQSTFVTNGNVNIISGADFTFQAGENIDLNPGFETEAGAAFVATATPAPCTIEEPYARQAADGSELKNLLHRIPVPQEKKFDITKYLPAAVTKKEDNVNSFNLYPNPSTGIINVELFLKEREKNVLLDIYDLYGRHVYSKKYSDIYFIKEQFTLPSTNSGMYNLIIKTTTGTYSKRIILAH